jgi:malonyl-CoA/methylmalonyl-CoA synthetase
VLIHALPIYHTHGLFVASNVTLFARASMIFLPKLDPELMIKLMARATVMMGVPTFYTRLLQSPALTKESTKHMRLFISGSAPLLADTHREWSARTGHAVLERYGMTETNMNTSNPYDGERVPGAVGHPLPGVSVRVTDPETGEELARDEIGMIEVKGPNVFKGYWRMPEKTKSEFRDDGFFITGDLGKIDPKGYVHILGRGKDLVISGGFNVYPKEIESEIDAMPGVIESAVIGVPHADFGAGARWAACKVQDAEARVRGRRTAAQRHGQGAEEYFAGYLREDLREVARMERSAIREQSFHPRKSRIFASLHPSYEAIQRRNEAPRFRRVGQWTRHLSKRFPSSVVRFDGKRFPFRRRYRKLISIRSSLPP